MIISLLIVQIIGIYGQDQQAQSYYDEIEVKVIELCKNQTCNTESQCSTCFSNICCSYKDQVCFKQPYVWVPHLQSNKSSEANFTKLDVKSLVSYPSLGVEDQVPLYNATNFVHKRFDYCGIPAYCPKENYLTGSVVMINFEIQEEVDVSQGELCTWFFEGDLGPAFFLEIIVMDIMKQNTTTAMLLSICYNVGHFSDQPCTFQILFDKLKNGVAGYLRIPMEEFRLTLQFMENTKLNLSQFQMKLISYKKLSKEQAEKLFETLLIVLGLFFGLVIVMSVLKYCLFRFLGRRIRFLNWINQPLIHSIIRRPFDCQKEIENLKEQHIIQNIVFKADSIRYDQDSCSYCLDSLNCEGVIQLFCGHAFHEVCFTNHLAILKKVGNCSICNVELTQQAYLQYQALTRLSSNTSSTIQENEMVQIQK